MEVDRLRYERDIERAFFTAWCTEMFARQKTLDQWGVALNKLRSARDGKAEEVFDWHLEQEHMQAIRERQQGPPPSKRKGSKT